MNNDPPKIDLFKISSENVLLNYNDWQKQKLMYAYSVLLGRIFCKIRAFEHFKRTVPEHIPHEFMTKMSERSIVLPLPIQFKNESKHEDCLAIIDCYEDQLSKIHRGAFGKIG